jgi:hypothetical protein
LELRDLIDRLDKNAARDARTDGRRQREQS